MVSAAASPQVWFTCQMNWRGSAMVSAAASPQVWFTCQINWEGSEVQGPWAKLRAVIRGSALPSVGPPLFGCGHVPRGPLNRWGPCGTSWQHVPTEPEGRRMPRGNPEVSGRDATRRAACPSIRGGLVGQAGSMSLRKQKDAAHRWDLLFWVAAEGRGRTAHLTR